MRYAVITGVSTGIGRATARELVTRDYRVFGSVRRQQHADELREELGQAFTPLFFDLTDRAAIRAAADDVALALDGRILTGLINNAGVAVGGPLMEQPMDEIRRHFEVNIFGSLAVTRAFLPHLGGRLPPARRPGRIIQVGSVLGEISIPFLGAYAATKHALEAITDALRCELMLYGIDVVLVQPGVVRTAIWDKADAQDPAQYADSDYLDIMMRFRDEMVTAGKRGLSPERVSRLIAQALESPRPRTRYPLPDQPITGWLMPRLLPDRWLDRLMARKLGLGTRKPG